MRFLIVFLLTFLSATILLHAQVVGKLFPNMVAETVDDKRVSLPKETKGKFTLLGLAYSKKSEDELNSWFQPVYQKFIQKNTGLFESFSYDVNVYFIPMFTGVNAAATGTAKKRALKDTDPKLLPHILFYKGDLKTYKEALDFEKKDTPYFFVLDKDGKIVYATSGKYTPEKVEEAEALME
jgi:hypothetical protein